MFSFQEAGKAYFEAARVREEMLGEYKGALENYRDSERCYFKINSINIIDCYAKIIDDKINWAIQYGFEFGYKIGILFGDENKREEFYKRAEDIRSILLKTHTCAMTKFDRREYESNLGKAFNDREKSVRADDAHPSATKKETVSCGEHHVCGR
ncbi:hypothetical protein RF11_03053 [Thelohanellus kitauei]|uniref:Uncharacterized protein n=1 Tax=Thelohanellus kitauei TaxID=669202 RepID=A0A0C2N4L8_THEKT|nr:hypothetical protein RF11_03053 [Thelohanellus kitauei]